MPISDGFSGRKEKAARHIDAKRYNKEENTKEQAMLDQLLDAGFRWDEAVKLLMMRENLCENAEMRQRMNDDYRMHFVKWLYERGIVGEESA